jgi:hypothetical protein
LTPAATAPAAAVTLLDEALPQWDVHEVHSAHVPAPPAVAYAAMKAVKPAEVRLLAPLMAVRALPTLLSGRWLAFSSNDTLIESFLRNGFAELGEREGSEYLVGGIGPFWKLRGYQFANIGSLEEFVGFDEPGYGKAAVNLTVEPEGTGSRVSTETRVIGTDPAATRSFRRYWWVISPGSALIRISLLNAIRRRSQR